MKTGTVLQLTKLQQKVYNSLEKSNGNPFIGYAALGRKLSVERGTVWGIIDALIVKGLVAKRKNGVIVVL